ncbi:MAG: hypothetical protein U0736_20120 [Gemmataceae bacterium]
MMQLAAAGSSVWDVLWYRPVPATPVDPGPRRKLWPNAPRWRRCEPSWTEPAATFLLKGGSPSYNHAQADLGSFVLDRAGGALGDRPGQRQLQPAGYFDGRADDGGSTATAPRGTTPW